MRLPFLRALAPAAALATLLAVAPVAGAADTPDPWITTKVKLALFPVDGVNPLEVNVDTVDGRVTLHGKVESDAAKQGAEQAARDVAGVREVRNLLAVVPAERAEAVAEQDDAVRDRVAEALRGDPAFADVEVASVSQGTVVLGGSVDTMSAHMRALETARGVRGVEEVQSQVRSPDRLADEEVWRDPDVAAPPSGSRDAEAIARDAWITTASKVRLLATEGVGLGVNVDTRDGVVTLFGTVETDAAKERAAAEVKQVGGVREVRNELQVVPAERQEQVAASDDEIEGRVEQALGGRDELGDADIDVAVENGVVRLSGTVTSQADRLAALTAARQADGVRSVVGDLEVARE